MAAQRARAATRSLETMGRCLFGRLNERKRFYPDCLRVLSSSLVRVENQIQCSHMDCREPARLPTTFDKERITTFVVSLLEKHAGNFYCLALLLQRDTRDAPTGIERE